MLNLALSVLMNAVGPKSGSLLFESEIWQFRSRAFLDDLTVTTTSAPGCRCIVQVLKKLIGRVMMTIKTTKSGSIVPKRENGVDLFCTREERV